MFERSEERKDSRNGSRDRGLKTRIRQITLQAPRNRSVPFKRLVFENYCRSESALLVSMVAASIPFHQEYHRQNLEQVSGGALYRASGNVCQQEHGGNP